MPKPLTARSVEGARPGASRKEIPDGALPGLYLVVQPGGAKGWALRYRFADRPRKLTLGRSPALSLPAAREVARAALRTVAEGRDPGTEKQAARADAASNRFGAVAEAYLERHVRPNCRPRTAEETERLLRVHVLPHWRNREIQTITRRDVRDRLDKIIDGGAPVAANRTLAALKALFTWAVRCDLLDASPCAGVEKPTKEKPRDRVLNDDELRWLWLASDRLGFPFGCMTRMLLLTGARRNEVVGMTEAEIADGVWTIPAERVKNGSTHALPLPDMALNLIAALPRIENPKRYLFTTNGRTAVSGFSRAKGKLARLMLAEARREANERGDDPDAVAIPEFGLHDLRRTLASGMARLGIALPVVERVLNHKSGSFAGIVAVYQRHDFAPEMARALNAWATHVAALVEDKPAASNVVALR